MPKISGKFKRAVVNGKIMPESVWRKLAEMKVKEVMNRRPRTVRPDTSIDGLLERMLGEVDPCFPVVDKDMNLVGIVTESDVLEMFSPIVPEKLVGSVGMRRLMKTGAEKVEKIMSEHPISVEPETKIGEVLQLMHAHKLRRIPVVKGKKLVGLVHLRDIIQAYRFLK